MQLYAIGSNGSGQLGIGGLEDISSPQRCRFYTEQQELEPSGLPVKIVAGGNITYILFDNGDLYRAGRGAVLPTDQKTSSSSVFEEIWPYENRNTMLCSSTWNAVVFVNSNREVFVQGSGPAGELCLGPEIKHCAYAKKLQGQGFPPSGLTVVDIASSLSHTVVILSNGEAWGWGNGRKGQLGEPAEVVWIARKITGIGFPAVRVACGREFTFLVGEPSTGQYVIFGSDKWGIKSKLPTKIRNWRDIGASWGSLFVLDDGGLITSWGRNDRGQLAPPDLPPIQQLSAGSEHVLVLSKEGNVLVWGWGEHGNCGSNTDEQGDVKNGSWNVIPLHNLGHLVKISGIGAGCATSFIWIS